MVAALEDFQGFSEADVALIAEALPPNSQSALLPILLEEWAEVALPDHLLHEPYPEKTKRNARLKRLLEAPDGYAEALSGLTETDVAMLAHRLAGDRGSLSCHEICKERQKWARAIRAHQAPLEEVKRAASAMQVVIKRGNPPNRIAYLVMLDFAEIFRTVTGKVRSRTVSNYIKTAYSNTAGEAGPFYKFMCPVWSVLFKNGQDGLSAATRRWAEMRVKSGERSAFIGNILIRSEAGN